LPEEFSLIVVTYRRDLEMTRRLVESIARFNVDSLPVFLICPDSDIDLFQQKLPNENLRFIAEDSIETTLFDENDPETFESGVGYMNQQIFKLAFSTLGLSDIYLCLDSDVVFTRPFTKWDFINQRTNFPYLFQSEDRELQSDHTYLSSWDSREAALRRIEVVVGAPKEDPFIAVHGFQVFSTREIRSMTAWLATNSHLRTFKEMLAVSGYEFNWYTTWVRTHSSDFIPREPIFKTFHTPRELFQSLLFQVSEEDYARGYVGVCVNGNFQHGRGTLLPLSLRSNPAIVGGVYLSFGEIFRIAFTSMAAIFVAHGAVAARLINQVLAKARK
jgi:hypothetical protein